MEVNWGSAFKQWVCVFPGKMGICWKLAHWDWKGTREEAEELASKNCNVIPVPIQLWEKIDEYQKRTAKAERLLDTIKFLRSGE